MFRTIGKSKHVWMNGAPRTIAEPFGLAQSGIEHLSFFHYGAWLESRHSIVAGKIFVESGAQYGYLYFLHWILF